MSEISVILWWYYEWNYCDFMSDFMREFEFKFEFILNLNLNLNLNLFWIYFEFILNLFWIYFEFNFKFEFIFEFYFWQNVVFFCFFSLNFRCWNFWRFCRISLLELAFEMLAYFFSSVFVGCVDIVLYLLGRFVLFTGFKVRE